MFWNFPSKSTSLKMQKNKLRAKNKLKRAKSSSFIPTSSFHIGISTQLPRHLVITWSAVVCFVYTHRSPTMMIEEKKILRSTWLLTDDDGLTMKLVIVSSKKLRTQDENSRSFRWCFQSSCSLQRDKSHQVEAPLSSPFRTTWYLTTRIEREEM